MNNDFSISFAGVSNGYELNPTDFELAFIERIKEICSGLELRFERRSQNYLSAICGQNDFLRFKLTEKTKWFSVFVFYKKRAEYINSPLFAQQDKKERLNHWKVKINTFEDIEPYEEVIRISCQNNEVAE